MMSAACSVPGVKTTISHRKPRVLGRGREASRHPGDHEAPLAETAPPSRRDGAGQITEITVHVNIGRDRSHEIPMRQP